MGYKETHHQYGKESPKVLSFLGVGQGINEPQLDYIFRGKPEVERFKSLNRIKTISKEKQDKLYDILSKGYKDNLFWHQKGKWKYKPNFRKISYALNISCSTVICYYSKEYRRKIYNRIKMFNKKNFKTRKVYNEKNKIKLKEQAKEYRKKYKEEVYARNKKWREQNRQYDLERRKIYRESEKGKAKIKEYKNKNKEKMRIYQKKYYLKKSL